MCHKHDICYQMGVQNMLLDSDPSVGASATAYIDREEVVVGVGRALEWRRPRNGDSGDYRRDSNPHVSICPRWHSANGSTG